MVKPKNINGYPYSLVKPRYDERLRLRV